MNKERGVKDKKKAEFTERKQSEEKIRRQHDLAKRYLDIAGVMMVVINSNREVELINRKGCEILGYNEDRIIGKNWFEHFLPQKNIDEVKNVFDRLMKGEVEPVEYFENPVLCKSGEEKIIAWHNTILKDENDSIIGTLSSGLDITERKRMEELQRENEYYLNKAQKITQLGHWKLDPVTEEVSGSDELFHIFGLKSEEASLDAFVEVVHPDDREFDVGKIKRGIEYGENWDIEHRLLCKDGRLKWVHAIGEAIVDENGKTIQLVGTVQDITERKKMDATTSWLSPFFSPSVHRLSGHAYFRKRFHQS